MASEAQVDLIISTAGTLPDLERDLERIVNAAEASADPLEIQAVLDRQETIAALIDDVTDAISAVNTLVPEIEVDAALDTLASLQEMQDDLDNVIDSLEASAEEVRIEAELDADLAELDAELAALVAELEASAPEVDLEVDVDRDGGGARQALNLGKAFKSIVSPVAKVAAGIGALGVASSTTLPLLAGVVAAVEQIAPAAALAAPAILTVALAAGTTKLAMQGVGDAVKLAFDPGTDPAKLAEALKDLAPAARAFVVELSRMKGGLKAVQQDLQGAFFKDFDVALRTLGERTLPIFARAARNTSITLNQMGHEVASAALELGNNGTLGRALSSSNIALFNLTKVPGQVVTAFGQLAAAAGPTFERLSKSAADAATRISERLSAAFESGALDSAISGAVDALAQLGRSVGNIFEGLGNIFATVTAQGGGLFAALEQITQAFADVTATKGFQDALKALVALGSELTSTILPLISQALQALGPVFQELGPPLQILVKALGDGLGQIIPALTPVLVALANAFGRLVGLVTPFIDLAADLVVALLPALVPLFQSLGQAFNAMIPFVKQLVENIGAQLLPVFTALATKVLPQILPPLTELAVKIFPILTDILVKLGPSMVKLGEAFAEILVALAPLIVQLVELTLQMVDKLMPVIQPLIDLLIKLATGALGVLVFQIATIVVPAIRVLVDLLKGDFRGAWEGVKDIVSNVGAKVGEIITRMKDKVVEQLQLLVARAQDGVRQIRDRFVQGFQEITDRVRERVNQIPGIVQGALANAGTFLVSAGQNIVQGLINGIQNRLGRLREVARSVADTVSGSVKDFLGIRSPSKVMMGVGGDTMEGLVIGIQDKVPDLRRELQGVAALAPSFALPNGDVLPLPQLGSAAPVVQVYLGNELINNHVDTRIAQSTQARELLMVRGIRR